MSRSERLFQLLQALRSPASPVTAQQLAHQTGVSLRSVYRDIDTLRAGGADIAGAPGAGYTLVDDGTLAPRTFTRIEIEALTLGLAQVRQMGDPALATAADAVLGKVAATLPSLGQQHMLHAVSRVHRFGDRAGPAASAKVDMELVRRACWREEALDIHYTDREGVASRRTIWPLAIMYVDKLLVVLARCCLRDDFRMFRVDRIARATSSEASFRPRRAELLRTYLARLDSQATASPRASGKAAAKC
ncbi:YafY family protein [Herbaspirillum sp. YR522]|uniref:helix-turn-helix transcriptional regulator n=1 Tax=Herbaspirillum sp. YR522 TaxID=1144342 RepID=UPI00026FA268|nr:YafY family protein [Herbaspirillum sp. YR522]EJN07869.1 putative transcriptional regulator [Herbaspirillum sp. YR522]